MSIFINNMLIGSLYKKIICVDNEHISKINTYEFPKYKITKSFICVDGDVYDMKMCKRISILKTPSIFDIENGIFTCVEINRYNVNVYDIHKETLINNFKLVSKCVNIHISNIYIYILTCKYVMRININNMLNIDYAKSSYKNIKTSIDDRFIILYDDVKFCIVDKCFNIIYKESFE